jgi:small conductance mechanosensitive channel
MFNLLVTGATTTTSTDVIGHEVDKKVGALTKFWNGIQWDKIIGLLIGKAIYLVIAGLLFLILYKFGRYLIERAYKNYAKHTSISETRAKTLQKLIDNVFQYSMFFIIVYTILSILGIPVASLVAGAGIAAVAIGLGAQGFMNDLITGIFIIIEQQIDVGDHVRFSNLNIEGNVIAVGIRTTKLKSKDGVIHFIPNRNITTISNLSRSDIRVTVDVRIKPEEGFDEISKVIQVKTDELAKQYIALIAEPPSVFGMVDLGEGNFAIRVQMYVANGEQLKMHETFLSEYVKVLMENNFTIPNTSITIPTK